MAEPQTTDVDRQAVAAALEVLGPTISPDTAARALKAAADVYEATSEDWADQQLTDTRLYGMDIDDGLRVRLRIADETAAHLVMVMRAYLDAGHPENYVQQEVVARDTGERYVFIVQQPGGKTPHQLRLEAEEEVRRLRAKLVQEGQDA